MTASEIAKALGVTEGTKTFKFQEPVDIIQAKGCMSEAHYTMTQADITERAGWTQIIVKGTWHYHDDTDLPMELTWRNFLAPARHLLENALLKSNA